MDERRERPDKAQERRSEAQREHAGAEGDKSPLSPAQALRERSAALNVRHKDEWRELGRTFSRAKSDVYDRWRDPLKEERAQHKADIKPIWRDHFAEERKQAWERQRMERSFFGRLGLSIAAAREQARSANGETPRSFATHVLANLIDRDRREGAFEKVAERDRKALARDLKLDLEDRIADLKEERAMELDQVRDKYGRDREGLIERQNVERAEIRDAWRQLYQDRGLEWKPHRAAEPDKPRDAQVDREVLSDSARSGDRDSNQGKRSPLERLREATQEKTAEQERKPSAFDWLDRQADTKDERSALERLRDAAEKAPDKDQERGDDRER